MGEVMCNLVMKNFEQCLQSRYYSVSDHDSYLSIEVTELSIVNHHYPSCSKPLYFSVFGLMEEIKVTVVLE